MLYLVDGYNVTKHDPATRALSLEGQRDALVARLQVRGSALLGSGRILVVWDGQGGAGVASGGSAGGIRIEQVFSRDRDADDEIVARVRASKVPVTVVTSDRELQQRVSSAGAARVEVRERGVCFESAGKGAARGGRRTGVARDTGIPAHGNAITEELKALWLDEGDE